MDSAEKRRIRQREWYKNHRKEKIERVMEYYWKNHDKKLEYGREYYHKNKKKNYI